MTKRKAPAKKVAAQQHTRRLRCTWHTRLIIPAEQTPTGTRYEFAPDQEQDVDAIDAHTLLSKKRDQVACCGGAQAGALRYFEEVL